MVLVLLGERIPGAARAFLVGLAIVDDLGAILIITFAYTSTLDTAFLWPTGFCVLGLLVLNLTGVRRGLPYVVAGLILWLLFLKLGLHGTLAGVVVALVSPVRPAISRRSFVAKVRDRLEAFEAEHDDRTGTILEQPQQQKLALDMLKVSERATVPMKRWETRMQLPVSFLVMPAFAFMNAGIDLSGVPVWTSGLSIGIGMGLLLGKPVGIVLGVWVGSRLGLAVLPESLTWRHVIGIGLLGAIGFTMSLFIATLSFGDDSVLLEAAKQSIITTSLLAGLIAYAWLRWACPANSRATSTRS